MEVSVLNIKGQDTGKKVTLNDSVFGVEPNDHAIYLDVKQYLAAQRQGTAKTKERSELSGSTRKLGRQKGGGEGRQSGGHPRSRTGLYAKGLKTRAPKKQSNKYIIERRKK